MTLRACLPLCAALLLPLSACKKGAADDPAADSAAARSASTLSRPVVGAVVRKGDLVLTVATNGQVRSDVAKLRSEVAGTIKEVLVRPGQHVSSGQTLIRFDTRPFDLDVQAAEASVAEAQVRYTDNIVPDSVVSGQAPTEERRQNALARSGLAAARVALEQAKLKRDRAVITAPFTGVVDAVPVAAGSRVSPGDELATVVSLSSMRLEASVLEHDLPLVKQGGRARITTAAAPDRVIEGRIAAVLPLVDSTTRAGKVIVSLPNPGPLRPGMYADVQLESSRLPNEIIVPASAVLQREGRPLVFVVKDGKAKWTYVNPGRSNGAETIVLPDSASNEIPVAPGDTVLISGHLTLTHDAPVKVEMRKDVQEARD
jgi:RND family efflux transporter MFP subunit